MAITLEQVKKSEEITSYIRRADKLVINAAITMQKPFYKSINRY